MMEWENILVQPPRGALAVPGRHLWQGWFRTLSVPSHPSTGKLIPRNLRNPGKVSVSLEPLITILNKCAFFNFYIMSDSLQDDISTTPTRDSPVLTTDLPQQLIKSARQRTMPCSTSSREPGTASTQTQLSQ